MRQSKTLKYFFNMESAVVAYEPLVRLRIGKNLVLLVNEEGFENTSSEFRKEFLVALHKLLNKSIDFSSASITVKRELVDAEPVALKTLGIPWSYSFVGGRPAMRLLTFADAENKFDEVKVMACTLVLRCLLRKK